MGFGAVAGGRKRTFTELRHIILAALSHGQQTTNQISIKTGINWRTVEAHLTFLIGKGLVTEVLKSEYVRIFALTGEGKAMANSLLQKEKAAASIPEKKPKEEVIEL
ncbi:ArsR family transcriptional regulator [Candidatus Woesearchaeota archaeon]|nr:ArsR family transcriptional regulator [Candidatus Woesearchaeota archaeon]